MPRYGVKNPAFLAPSGIECSTFLPSALPNLSSHASPVSSFSQVKTGFLSSYLHLFSACDLCVRETERERWDMFIIFLGYSNLFLFFWVIIADRGFDKRCGFIGS